jgi:hypothetical protein
MTNTMKIILLPVGAICGGILAIALKHIGLLPAYFDGRWIAAGLALAGLILGHYIDNKRECARIDRELEQDRMRSESESGRSK